MSNILQALTAQGIRPTSLTNDSRRVLPGSLFAAYPGEQADGRRYIAQALERGAAAVVWESEGFAWPAEWQQPNMPVRGLRNQVGEIADAFYGEPSRQLLMVGITGTNGKTSCSQWLAQAMTELGKKSAVIGTLGNGFPGALAEAINTTPDPIILHGMLADYLRQGATAAIMEVSSHGLDQDRVSGVHFDIAVFTNLTRDHLDYHGDMASYAAAKRKLFEWQALSCAVLNVDDDFGREVAEALRQQGKQVLTYGFAEADVRCEGLILGDAGLEMRVVTKEGSAKVRADLSGRFNAYNLLAVIATLLASGFGLQVSAETVSAFKPVSGRMERYGGGQSPLVVIDYAHTPDALEKVLQALREQTRGKLVCVFGCGGDRDKGKRPLMGRVASTWADEVVLTSDNPRSENPQDIIHDIMPGVTGSYRVIVDRAAAIREAIQAATAGDVVLVAGKGHEDYQETAGVRHPYSDTHAVQHILSGASA